MDKNCVLAHDMGTSGNKAVLLSADGNVLAIETCEYPTHYPCAGYAEQDPEDWWQAVLQTTRQIVERFPDAQIAGMTFSGHMHACVCLDKAGAPIGRSLIWLDHRAEKQAQQLISKLTAKEIFRITGHRPGAMYTMEKLMWVKQNEPEVFAKTVRIVGAKDYVLHRLTGRQLTDYSDASGMGAYDINKRGWSQEICDAAGIDIGILPDVVSSTETVGHVDEATSRLTGLKQGTPIIAGGGDGACATAGAGAMQKGDAYVSVGTSAWIGITGESPMFDEEMLLTNYINLDDGLYMTNGSVASWGNVFDWAVEKLYGGQDDKFAVMEREIEKSPIGSGGLVFLPWLGGERSPIWNSNARACFLGLTFSHTRGDMMRAVTEGISINLGTLLGVMRNFIGVEEMNIVGGATNDACRQILADVFDARLHQVENSRHATALGAAMAAMVGLKMAGSFEEAGRFVEYGGWTSPGQGGVERYRELKPLYTKAYAGVKTLFEDIAEWDGE